MAKGAKNFLKQLNTDKAFAKKYFAAKTEKEKHELLSKEGFEFSQADVKKGMKEVALSDHVLDGVAGGLGCAQCANGWRW